MQNYNIQKQTIVSSGGGGLKAKNQVIATENQLLFTITVTPSELTDKLDMYWGGVLLPKDSYSYLGTTVTYIPANNEGETFIAGDRIDFRIY